MNPDPIVGKFRSLVLGKGVDPEPISGARRGSRILSPATCEPRNLAPEVSEFVYGVPPSSPATGQRAVVPGH